jgi:hypothetical protein
MATRYLLFLDHQQLGLWRWRRGALDCLARHPASEEGQAALGAWLRAHPGCKLRLVVNLAGEEFRVERIPALWGHDRQAVLARKRTQYFFDTPYTLTCTLSRHSTPDASTQNNSNPHQETQRQEEQVLFAALPRSALPEALSGAMRECRAVLDGLYSVSLVTGSLCRALRLSPDRALVFSFHPDGLRESLLMRGQVVFSRFTALDDKRIADDMEGCLLEEAEKLRRHLIGQHLIERDDLLSVYPLIHAQALAKITGDREDGLRFMPVDLNVAAARLGCKWKAADHNADFLFLHLAASCPPKQQFAPNLHDDRRVARAQRSFMAAGVVMLLVGVLLGGYKWHTARQFEEKSARLQTELLPLQAQLEEQREHWKREGFALDSAQDADHLRLLLERYAHLARPPACLRLETLGQALDAYPEVELEKLHWNCAPLPVLTVEGRLAAETPGALAKRFGQFRHHLEEKGARVEILTQPGDGASFRLRLSQEDKS